MCFVFYYKQDDGEIDDIPEETRNFLLEWLKGRPAEVSTQLTLESEVCVLVVDSEEQIDGYKS